VKYQTSSAQQQSSAKVSAYADALFVRDNLFLPGGGQRRLVNPFLRRTGFEGPPRGPEFFEVSMLLNVAFLVATHGGDGLPPPVGSLHPVMIDIIVVR